MYKTRVMITRYAQSLLILLAFLLMALSSYLYVSKIERDHLRVNTEEAILYTEVNINSDLMEPETMLGGVSETVRSMILNGTDFDELREYILFINKYLVSESNKRMAGAIGFYGFFNVYGGRFLSGTEDWVVPDDYIPANRPWYRDAAKAAGNICVTEPYVDLYTNDVSITFARQIFNKEGSPLGIVCLDMRLDRIRQYAVNTQFTENGYGFLLSREMEIIAHPEPSLLGKQLKDAQSNIALLQDELRLKGDIAEVVTTDYRNVKSIVFIHRLSNGWYMGIVTPKDSYFESTRKLALILMVLGVIFAALLIWILFGISAEMIRADERVQIMFNATPLCANFWDKNFNSIDCNKAAVELFGLASKQEYNKRFFELSPEYQPDGSLSTEKAVSFLKKAMDEGSCRFEWVHQKPDGEPIPCELTLVRVMYRNEYIVVGYTRDLREHKQMLMDIERRSHLLDTVNNAATILLSNYNEDAFETSMSRSFELIGTCLDVDRVQIWRNEIIDGELNFVLRYEWLSEFGQKCRVVPNGLHFPYSLKKEWENQFLRGEYINSPISDLPEEDKNFLGYYGMKSIVIIPMFLDNSFWGFFSIDDCRRKRKFSSDEISILTSAGLMLSSAVNRNKQSVTMREADERTQIMFDSAPFGACFWDKEMNIIDCNQEAVNMFDLLDKQEFIDKFAKLSPEYQPDGILSRVKGSLLVRKALEEGYSRFEWLHQKLNGESIPAEVTCVRVKHKNEFTVTEYIRDLREQKAVMAEMRRAELAEESSKAKSDFLAKMSHEIRTPMNAILGIAEIQLQDMSLADSAREAIERIYNSGDLLLGIINDILDLSKIEAGKMELSRDTYEVASLINDTVQLNIMRYESKPIEFKLDVDEHLPAILIGDELRIKQILNNLISNAFKYTQEGRIILNVSCETVTVNDNPGITMILTISDTGQGMTMEQVRKLGTEYSRFNMEANRKTEGTGLGMNITRNLIRMMNGSIQIDSTPGMGSTFTVKLPQEVDYSNEAYRGALGREMADNLRHFNVNNISRIRNAQITREFMPYGRVLIVDDVESNLYVAKGLMAPYGLSIDTALSGFEAVEKIRNGCVYDIIFMDHMMPRMDGIEATKIIRSMFYNRPIVALTANALAGQAEMFLSNGFDDFISKPIDIRQLNFSLNKLIRDKQPAAVVDAARRQKHSLYASGKYQGAVDPQLAEFFVRDAEKAIDVLESVYINKCRGSDDISLFVINTHAMKSALANIGENALSAEASKFEQLGRDRKTKEIIAGLPEFLMSLHEMVNKYKLNVNAADVTGEDEGNNHYLAETLNALKTACSDLDKKAAKEALSGLRQKTWPQSVKDQLSAMAGFLLHSDFDEVAKAADVLLKQV
ncbi:MAG: response regulator [Treponema sp.]|jgi:signal transduction histidine kinase/DNA-binding response OmpR family regulator/HPt (histidine-containing phosphotransfer) domain-containing protein|nr:response regulator [Treponema sp.]